MIVPPALGGTTTVEQFNCASARAAALSVVFPSAGSSLSGFALALGSDEAAYHVGEPQWLTARLTYSGQGVQQLDTSLPAGDYVLSVRAARDRADAIRPSSHLAAITVLRSEPVSATCPAYERFDLRTIFSLEPGEYRITATRLLRKNHRNSDRIGWVMSNEIRLVIRD